MDTPDNLLSVDSLHVSYGTKEVLRGIDYSISESEEVLVVPMEAESQPRLMPSAVL